MSINQILGAFGVFGYTWLHPRSGDASRKQENGVTPPAPVSTLARLPADELLRRLASSTNGLADAEAAALLVRFGSNQVAREQKQSVLREFAGRAKNPLNVLLLSLAAVSWIPAMLGRPSSYA